jgi:hypothetical protein
MQGNTNLVDEKIENVAYNKPATTLATGIVAEVRNGILNVNMRYATNPKTAGETLIVTLPSGYRPASRLAFWTDIGTGDCYAYNHSAHAGKIYITITDTSASYINGHFTCIAAQE